ncbi:WD40 repeat-like protein [Xylariomycetidae sp. FL2044]|nr:WD40 repeat-like protein [Xylariomycetidae sp. FL2044]
MDIHRCRFVPYPPSAINALAFSYPAITSKAQKSAPVRLAVGRANGNIEIWNPLGGLWHQESVLHGGKDRSIDGLVWVNEPDQLLQDGTRLIGKSRLFSIGYTSTVTEWDLENCRPKKQASGIHGDIWCLAVQPFATASRDGDKHPAKQSAHVTRKLVAGTMDGSLVLYSIDDDDLRFDRILVKSPSKKTKMVSLAFQSRNIVVVGCSDSAIRLFDMRNGATLAKMTLGSDLAGGAKEVIVWSVKCLGGGDIVSGDSTGQVCIWDGKTYTQAQRLQAHNQDVLSLAVSADASTIVSGGMDRKTVLYRKTSGSGSRWGKIWHRRYHSHDVKAVASFEGPGMSVVVTGGPDASPIVLPLREAGVENHRALSYLPHDPPLRSARRSRMIISWWDREVHVWKLKKQLRELVDMAEGESSVANNRKLVGRILIKGEANITSAAISDDGSVLVVATTSDVKAFHLKTRDTGTRDELKISKIDIPRDIASIGASKVQISPDEQQLCLIQQGNRVTLLAVLRDADPGSKPVVHHKVVRLQRISRKVPKHIAHGGLGGYNRSISQIAFSADSKVLAVADLAGYIDTWTLGRTEHSLHAHANGTSGMAHESSGDSSSEEGEDEDDGENGEIRWRRNPNGNLIPKLSSAPTVLLFSNHVPVETRSAASDNDAVDDYVLLAITAKPQVVTINTSFGTLTPWSRRNPLSRFPVEFRNTRDLVKGALWSGDRIWLYGNSFLFMMDLSQDLGDSASVGRELVKHGTKRKRGADSGAGSKMERGAAGPTKLLHHLPSKAVQEVPLDGPAPDLMDEDDTSHAAEESESEDSDDEAQGELAMLRGAQGKTGTSDSRPDRGLPFWHTYKYRPIFGMVPLSAAEKTTGPARETYRDDESEALEVALVERPLWEIDMSDRYFGEGEHEA